MPYIIVRAFGAFTVIDACKISRQTFSNDGTKRERERKRKKRHCLLQSSKLTLSSKDKSTV
jgi:hypothetical protein